MWNGNWKRDMCCLVDWLTFPGPPVAPNGTRLKKGDKVCVRVLFCVFVCVCCVQMSVFMCVWSIVLFSFPSLLFLLFLPFITLLSSHQILQLQYDLLPPSLARFSPTEPDILVYTGYGKETCVHFYSLSQRVVVRKMALTHWATCMDISPHGHLLAFGSQGWYDIWMCLH